MSLNLGIGGLLNAVDIQVHYIIFDVCVFIRLEHNLCLANNVILGYINQRQVDWLLGSPLGGSAVV